MISHMAKFTLTAFLTLVVEVTTIPCKAAELGKLDGKWEGKLSVAANSFAPAAEELSKGAIRLVISPKVIQVFLNGVEVKPKLFKMQSHMTNAVIFAINSGRDTDGTWVETWAFSVTLKDNDNLIVNYSHLVNNRDVPANKEGSKFFALAAGEFQRAGSGKD